jgi:hypothetical protein
MRDKNRPKTGRVKVYRFRLYDIASEDFKISARMATAACIRRIHAEPSGAPNWRSTGGS